MSGVGDPFTRDRYGRPLIPDGHGTVVPYQRVSTFANTLDDKSGLLAWHSWMAVKGAALQPDLAAEAVQAAQTPRDIMEELAVAGGSKTAAERGTDRHTLVQMRLQGEPLPDMPDDARREIERLYTTITSLGTVAGTEVPVVVDEFQVAGSMDYLLRDPDGTPIVADLKTGKAVYPLSVPIQLYCYARGQYWQDGQRAGWVADRRPRLVVIHAPQATTTHTVLEVDLLTARELTHQAVAIRQARKTHTAQTVWRTLK